jgi:hypothetical protein
VLVLECWFDTEAFVLDCIAIEQLITCTFFIFCGQWSTIDDKRKLPLLPDNLQKQLELMSFKQRV